VSVRVAVMGYLSIDTIEIDGACHGNVPGGAAVYAALGAAAAGSMVSLHATAGEDFSAAWLDRLGTLGIDTAPVRHAAGASRRAQLAYGADGNRDSPHHDDAVWWEATEQLAPRPPDAWSGIDLLVMAPMPIPLLREAMTGATRHGVRCIADTSTAFIAQDSDGLLALMPTLHGFAPSRAETDALFPTLDEDSAVLLLAELGPTMLHKRGPDGARLYASHMVAPLDLPAPRVLVRDPTGAGDATVGAFAAGIAAGLSLRIAAERALEIGARACTGIGPAALGLAP
jgi:ribokinase